MAKTQPALPIVLRAAAVWGTTVLGLRHLSGGQSFLLGDAAGSVLPKPDGNPVSDSPLRATGNGWELDARGATGGTLFLRGRQEDPAELARSGAPIPIVAGDYGLVRYGPSFSVFFQFAHAPLAIRTRRRIDWALVLAFLFSVVAVGGGLALIWAITTPLGIPKPLELTSQRELALRYNLKEEPQEPPKAQTSDDADKGQGVKDPGAKDKKEQGGGKKIKGAEGALGRQGQAEKTELRGEIKSGLGGMAEALSSDVGDEVRKTLGTISSVADALGGLRSDNIVLGQGSGTGLKGAGPGGGGTGEGVPFGAGTLDTGWGPGRGGGYGSGRGGPGGAGQGGFGKGGKGGGEGSGAGEGTGSGERKVVGKDAPKAGQGLSPSQISRVVMSRFGAFRACYESAAASDPSLQGSVGVSFSITPGGSVAAANIGGSSLSNPRVEGCIKRQFMRLSFPAADKGTNASWTFSFRPSKK
ncbi:MAG: AgmX/PglI C-terminal domain-containing protein [Polyangiaceae bacterium]|nr:AgmX/PglI C-terminal domain-containing protein [Polyangiaceae bacterium]